MWVCLMHVAGDLLMVSKKVQRKGPILHWHWVYSDKNENVFR